MKTDTDAQPGQETGAGSEDVFSDVRAAFEQHGASLEQDMGLGEKAAPEPEKPTDASAEKNEADRKRDEAGRFKKADDAASEAAPAEKPATKISDLDKPAEKPTEASTPSGPPPGWSADAKAKWSTLDPSIQADVIKREREIDEGGRRWSEEKRRYEDVIAPVRETARKYGVDEKTGLERLIAANDYLERDPVNAIRWLAQSYNVDLSQLPNVSQSEAPRPDPAVQTLHRELSQIKQTLSQREESEAKAEVERFAKDRPHFEEVRATMGRFLQSGTASTMEEAYDQAVWAVSTVREKVLAEREASSKAEREKAERERVEKARRGAVSLSGSPVSPPASKPVEYETTFDAARAAWEQHTGR